jgi:hypothetical protein
VGSSGSLCIPPRSMPEPDLMVLEPRPDFYRAVPSVPSTSCCSSRSPRPRSAMTAS